MMAECSKENKTRIKLGPGKTGQSDDYNDWAMSELDATK